MFILKNKNLFPKNIWSEEIPQTKSAKYTEATLPTWENFHSRIQLLYKGPQIYNHISRDIRNVKRIGEFKRRTKDYLKNVLSAIYSVYFCSCPLRVVCELTE